MGPSVQGRKVEQLIYGNLDAVGKALERRGGIDVPSVGDLGNIGGLSAKVAQGQGLDVNSLLNGAGQGQPPAIDIGGLATGQSQGQGQPVTADIGALLNGQQQQHKGAGLDASALLNGLAQGQGQGQGGQVQGSDGNNAADIANQLLAGQDKGNQGASIDQILNGIGANGKGQGNGQGGVEVIEVKETIIQQINGGGKIKETIVEAIGTGATSTVAEHKTTAAPPPPELQSTAPPPPHELTAPPAAEGQNVTTCVPFLLISNFADIFNRTLHCPNSR
jgi:hypothetical protein